MFEIDEKAVTDAVSWSPAPAAVPTAPPPPPPMPVVTSAAPPSAPEAVATKPASAPVASSPSPSIDMGDLPVAALAVPLLAAFAAATFFMRERVDEEASAAPASAPTSTAATTSNVVDLSIPYDAAAKLAYEKSDKSMAYLDFKKKFESDAVADVIAKKA